MNCFMKIAYNEALKAYKKNEIPVGAVIVKDDKIIAKSKNNRQTKSSVIGHAEISCILKAEKKLKDWRLDDCELYVTLEPCKMCETIIKESRIKKVYYLLEQNKKNDSKQMFSQIKDCDELLVNYKMLLESFFSKLR